ncbi:hypothetical protein RUM44_006408 [Polyplax serrata]|uniref:Transporter n=1 Tax=Polyplax serrata TaxID=468196 RepID=A0ABR1AI04_POLSC
MDNPSFQEDNPKSEAISHAIKPKSKYKDREKWSKGIEFVLSCIGFAVGLGNIWRFPYLCYKNGGGAFLVPYFICLVAGGIPIFFLEIAIGQYTSQGGITAWNFCPIFKEEESKKSLLIIKVSRCVSTIVFVYSGKFATNRIQNRMLAIHSGNIRGYLLLSEPGASDGIGYATTIICFLLNVYYIVILAWAIHFFFNSFRAVLPWSSCDNWWNTPSCIVGSEAKALREGTNSTEVLGEKRVDAIVEYWERKVLGLSTGIDDVSTLQWELVGTLFLAWILVYFCVWKGVKTSGKVVYFTAVFPYIMLTALLIRGVTLDGALEGITFYLRPDFSKLLESSVWIDAGTQIFFSYAIALGCMTALGSYNDFHNNFVKDCIFVSTINSCTSLYSGFAIFSVLGFMAKEHGVPIQEVAESGPGLVFIVYPKAISQMSWGPLWSFLFFFMILLMGIDSQFVGVEGFITAIVDSYPRYLRKGNRREIFIAGVSLVSFLIGLTMVTDGGMYMFQVFDYYSASGMVLLWMCFFECITIAYVYGVDKFYDNITEMIGYKIGPWLKICWLVFTPIITMVLIKDVFLHL